VVPASPLSLLPPVDAAVLLPVLLPVLSPEVLLLPPVVGIAVLELVSPLLAGSLVVLESPDDVSPHPVSASRRTERGPRKRTMAKSTRADPNRPPMAANGAP
jgi:hypothetical protein